ncbi:nuclear pore complex protein Nup214 [Ostrinia nubilalis]|uniref:nuclear pore complex protein Nup214 n=1 Tax=Ostrinia nubilalis TaxID=29057 RepID=UPI0030823524
MEVQFGPNPVDEKNLVFKFQRKIKVFNTEDPLPNRGYNLVASSSKYGIVFVASPDGYLSAYSLSELIDKSKDGLHLTVKLQEKPTHIAVSCDNELLAVTGGQLLCIYKVTDFQNQNVSPSLSLRCDVSPSTFVSAMQWNPCIPDSLVIVFFDGTLLACQASTSQVKKVQSKGRCLCWSPKGKQFVTGNSDGTLTQYKPDLTAAKSVPAPKLFEGAPLEALAIYWISTFQFAVVYKNATDNSRPAVTIVNTPKAGQAMCLNYEDVCYSTGSNRPWYYYLLGLAPWNLILASSSNAMEIATVASADGASWVQWSLSDEARAELPLMNKKEESYPVGVWIDTCAIHQLPWGENSSLPYMPLLIAVTHSGLLALINIINLNKQAPQLCSPPQQLTLPAAALTADIPGAVQGPAQPPAQTVVPQVTLPAPKPQPTPQPFQLPPQAVHSAPSVVAQPNTTPSFGASLGGFQQSAISQAFGGGVVPQAPKPAEPKPVEVKPAPPQPAQTTPVAPKPQPPPAQNVVTPEALAAVKAEQERHRAFKAKQELKNMIVKEVNEFQMELYKFTTKIKQQQTEIIDAACEVNLNTTDGLDAEALRKECSMEELRAAIVQLKLELVRACAVVAEARTHAEANDHQWTQTDPLTTKRVDNIKKLAYYVQNQVDRAYKALDYRWNQQAEKESEKSTPGPRMIRPVLDEVYQPLVKQQEILSRQEAMLRTFKNTLKEVDTSPMFRSTSLLRSTPFKNKDQLTKLSKNILNMSLEPQKKTSEPLLSAQKLDALRDMLSNHKTVKVKPFNVELRQQLANMRLSYEKAAKEREAQEQAEIDAMTEEERQKEKERLLKAQAVLKERQAQLLIKQQELRNKAALRLQRREEKHVYFDPPEKQVQAPPDVIKVEPKPDKAQDPFPISVPSFTPLSNNAKPAIPGLNAVARTLFTEPEPPKPIEAPKPLPLQTQPPKPPSFASPQPQSPSANTRSVLKDLLQNKQANATAKNDANTFMGQKICSPTGTFSFGSSPITSEATSSEPSTLARSLDTQNMFSNLQGKLQSSASAPNTSLLSENRQPEQKPLEAKAEIKQPIKIALKVAEKAKENIPEKVAESVVNEPDKNDKKEEVKPFSQQSFNFGSSLTTTPSVTTISEPEKPAETKPEVKPEPPKVEEKVPPTATPPSSVSSSASSLFAQAHATSPTTVKPQPLFGSALPTSTQTESAPTSTSATETSADTTEKPALVSTATSASSLFSAAVASSPKTTQSGSIFNSSSPSSPSSVFGSSSGSIFGSGANTATSSVFGTSTTPSLFSSDAKTATTATSAFGVTSTTQSVFASTPSVFSQATSTPSSVFSTATTGSLFGTASNQSSVFGTSTTPATTSAFGVATTQQSVFGVPATTAQSLFASAASNQTSVFGTPATTTQSVFGSGTATTQASVFGGGATQSVFGSSPPTSQPSLFGSPSGQTSVFGAAPTTQASVFGSPTPTTQASVFGSPTQTTQASVFGSPTQTTQASVFGSPTQTTQASVFGSPTQTTQASVFGSATPTTQTLVFGSTPATTGGSLFGGAESNLFAAASISTTNAPSQNTGGSIFGGSSPGSVFGGANTNVFGGKTLFGQNNQTAASIFGGGAAFGQKQPQANNFWSGGTSNTTSTGFGSGFGQQPSTQASSIFGSATGGSFSTPQPAAQGFGSPQQAPAFGSPQQQASPAFGGSPVFGSKPVFGQSTGFGSPTASSGFGSFGGFNKSPTSGFGAPAAFGGGATFGGAPAFGSTSPGKVFGGSPGPAFGSPTQSNATFESLATQNTLTFGNLAQQCGQPQPQAAPSFNASPAFTGWRG